MQSQEVERSGRLRSRNANADTLIHPRHDLWEEHFVWNGLRIIGLTAVGRTTVRVLDLNTAVRLRVRLATGVT